MTLRTFPRPRTLKGKLILYVTLVAIVPAIAAVLSYTYDERRMHDQIVLQDTANDLSYVMRGVDERLRGAGQLCDWTFFNRTIQKLVRSRRALDDLAFTQELIRFQESVDDLLMSSAVGPYVSTLLIVADNDVDVRSGLDAALIDKVSLAAQRWFQELLESGGGSQRRPVVVSPAAMGRAEYVIPFAQALVDTGTGARIGWIYIGFRPALVVDALRAYSIAADEHVLLADSDGTIIYSSGPGATGTTAASLYPACDFAGLGEGVTVLPSGERAPLVICKTGPSGWLVAQKVSRLELASQTKTLFYASLLILLGSLCVTAALAVFLSSRLTSPLARILARMRRIAQGDFARDPEIEGRDELGLLGHGINDMSGSIRQLLDRLLAEEGQKRRLELAMLQYQINPHFLYNTLNALRWMAIMQKADGVRDAITALGRLLRNTLGDTETTLREELALLDDYVLIQKLRTKDRFEVVTRVDSPDSLDCRIPKMTLQPLVENALFHGLERKRDAGQVSVRVAGQRDHVEVVVEDDGAGMTESEIEAAFAAEQPAEKPRGFSRIGIRNVHDRIRLAYGEPFGLSIESAVGAFTRVRVRLPRRVPCSA